MIRWKTTTIGLVLNCLNKVFFNKRVQLKNLQNLLQRVFFYLKKNVNSVTLAICT